MKTFKNLFTLLSVGLSLYALTDSIIDCWMALSFTVYVVAVNIIVRLAIK